MQRPFDASFLIQSFRFPDALMLALPIAGRGHSTLMVYQRRPRKCCVPVRLFQVFPFDMPQPRGGKCGDILLTWFAHNSNGWLYAELYEHCRR